MIHISKKTGEDLNHIREEEEPFKSHGGRRVGVTDFFICHPIDYINCCSILHMNSQNIQVDLYLVLT